MTFKPDILPIPLKRGYDVDILKPLKNLITSRYQASEQESYVAAINEFAKLRSNAVGRALDYHESSLELICKYYDQLVALESKIPASELQIPFKWKDAFERGSIFGSKTSKTVSSIGYERACVMFNIAALQSQVAYVQSPDSDEGLKLSAKLLQQAAGELTSLKGWVLSAVGSEPTADMQPDTLTALAALMLAQAQEVFVSKAIQDRMKPAVIAKLCQQCEELFSEATKHMGRETLKPLWDRDWLSILAGKQFAFSALAQFYQSRVCNDHKSVGEEIARLRQAVELFKSAEARSGNTGQVSDHIGKAENLLKEAIKDNDFIYHERVPDMSSLSAIGRAPVAKALPVPDRFTTNFSDVFHTLVPIQVQQALSQLNVRRQDTVNREVSKLKEATQLLNSVLASLNLPAAVEETGAGDGALPPSLREKAATVAEKGGLQTLERIIKELPELLQRNTELLDECDRQLKEERDSDEQLRDQFKEKWTRTLSSVLTATFMANAAKYRKVIETAVKADSTVRNKLDANRQGMELLSGGPDFLCQSLPTSTSVSGADGNAPAVVKLRQLMKEVDDIKREREALETEFKDATVDMRDQFLAALAADGAINEPVLSTEKIGEVFRELQQRVSASCLRQEALIVGVQEGHEELVCRSGAAEGEREKMLKMVAASHDVFTELSDNLKEGTKFYNDLTQLLVTFQGKISDFCFARRTEKEELLKDLTSGLASANTGPAPQAPAHHTAERSSAPPPRPPPPSVTPAAPPTAPPTAPNPYHGAPAPYAQQAAYQHGAPPPQGQHLPYPVAPQGMPAPPGGYYTPQYPVYTPMPQGYNPYFNAAPAQGYPQGTFPPQQGGTYPPYPQQSMWPKP